MNQQKNKRNLLIGFAVIMFVLGCVWLIQYFAGFRTLVINVEGDNTKTVLNSNNNETVSKEVGYGSPLRLKKGSYTLTTTGQNYETLVTKLDVTGTTSSLTLKPNYTKKKLSELLISEQSAINEVISSDIPKTKNFKLRDGRLYQQGQWYGVVAEDPIPPTEIQTTYVDSFKIILKKTNGGWKTLTPTPKILLTAKDFPDIPREILLDINRYAEPANRQQ